MQRVIWWILILIPCVPAGAAPSWPASATQWNPVPVGVGIYEDALAGSGADNFDTPPPAGMDLVGGMDPDGNGPFATGFWYSTAEDLMFRMRVDGDPTRATAELGRPGVELIVSRTVDAVRKSITHR